MATRNYIGVISSVNCSANVCRAIGDAFRGAALEAYPNVDGVVSITHKTGCAMPQSIELLQRVMAGYIRHVNFAAVLFIGLGCETLQIAPLMEAEKFLGVSPAARLQHSGRRRHARDHRARRSAGAGNASRSQPRYPPAGAAQPFEPRPGMRRLGGYSGISANPALGVASDLLVEQGGTAILSETPEIFGAEHLLTRRAVSREVGEKLIERIRWWEQYTVQYGGKIDNNPSPGNKAGGLTSNSRKISRRSCQGREQ